MLRACLESGRGSDGLDVDGVPVGAPCLFGVRGCGVGGGWGAAGSRRTLRARLESGRGGGCGVGRDDVALRSALIWKAGGVVVLSPRSFGGSVGLNEASTLF